VLWDITPDNSGSEVADALAITNNTLVALHSTHIVAYDLATGNELWDTDLGLEIICGSPLCGIPVEDMLAVDGKVAFALYMDIGVLDVTDGSVIWHHDIDTVSCGQFADANMASDGDSLFIMSVCRDQLRKYDLDTGIELWSETAGLTRGDIALANNVVYVNGLESGSNRGYVSAYRASDGQFLQRLDVTEYFQTSSSIITSLEYLAVANGKLMGVIDRPHATWQGILFFFGSTGNLYLPLFNEDESPDTNPDAPDEVSIVDQDGVYGAEIQVAAQIGPLSATLKIYHAGGGLYKEGGTEPDEHGNGFWIAPLEYTAAGYEYQVILNDGTELPLRQVLMPADPVAGTDYFVQSNGLSWVSPPTTITSAPYTLTLTLPAGFPITTTNAFAMMRSAEGGSLLIPGARVGHQLFIQLDENNAINGEHTFTTAASAGNFTAYGPGITVTLDAPELPDVRVAGITGFQAHSDGSYTTLNYSFERERPAVDAAVQADAQIAEVIPDPGGYQVTLWVKTPPEDPLDARTSKWEVGVMAMDQAGNELDRSSTEIPATPDGRYLVMRVIQPGSRPIASLAAFGATLEDELGGGLQSPQAVTFPDVSSQSNFTNTDAIAACTPPLSPFNLEPLKKITDILEVQALATKLEKGAGLDNPSIKLKGRILGQNSEMTCITSYYSNPGGAKTNLDFGERAFGLRRYVDRYRGEIEVIEVDGSSGDLSFDYKADFEGGRNRFSTCVLRPTDPDPGCCTGSLCTKGGKLAGPPGNDHPDDTESVVLQNDTDDEQWSYWQGVFAYANARGFTELAELARFHLLELAYLEEISGFPGNTVPTDEQQRVLNEYDTLRLFSSAELLDQRDTIAAQQAQLESDRANVLANGYHGEMQAMLTAYGIPSRLISPNFSPDAITGSMIVIPTAGFYGLETDPAFAERLSRFVEQGGTLVVMTQPGDQSIDLLPGSWNQVDYQRDISCYIDAMTLVQFHPVLASVSEPTFSSHVDGYMTAIPGSAQLLMERTKNQQGAFVFYEHGLGRMIVTNMYDDWGRSVSQSTQQVRDLFRDVMRWGSLGGVGLPEVGPWQAVQVTVDVENVTFQDSSKLKWLVRDPNGNEVDSGLFIQDLALSPDQTSQQIVNFTPGDATLGIWSLNYRLLDGAEEVVQGETQAGYFIVKDPPVLPLVLEPAAPAVPFTPRATDADVTLSLDQAAYQPGETVTATLAISLTDPGAVNGLKVNVSLGETSLEQMVPAVANQQVVFNLPADFSNNGLFFYGVYESTYGEGLYLNTRWVQPAGTGVTIVPASPTYTPGQTVILNITGNYTRTIFVESADFARSIDVSSTITVAFGLPEVLSSGPVRVQYEDSGFLRTARFDVIGPRLTVKGMTTNQSLIPPGGVADVYANIESDQELDVLIAGHIVDGDGFLFPTVYLTTTLVPGQQTLTMTMPISTSTSGSVHYQMEILDATKTAVSYVQAHRFFTIDAPALQAVRAAGGPTVPDNKPEVSLDWYAPSAGSLDVTLWLDQQAVVTETVSLAAGFTTTDLTIPGTLTPGVYELYAESDLGNGVTTSAHGTLTVEAAGLSAVYLPMIIR
jgi:hypothetical protein